MISSVEKISCPHICLAVKHAPCVFWTDQETEHADFPNGDVAEVDGEGEEMAVAVSRKTKRKK